ncbi:MAG: hypothetical protein HC923_08990 [Myxococcales bacterium]|nr:hypothetical protein [Myxococcales bacterium]
MTITQLPGIPPRALARNGSMNRLPEVESCLAQKGPTRPLETNGGMGVLSMRFDDE